MRRVSSQSTSVERLEGRRLFVIPTHGPGEGFDIQLVSDVENDTTPVADETVDPVKRVPIEGGFKWLDGTSSQDLIAHGGELEYVMVDGWNIWPRDMTGVIRTGEPSEVNTRWLANYAVTRTSTLIIDIENWAMDLRYYSKTVVDQNIARFSTILRWIREEQPGLKVGIYSIFPVSDLYNTVQYELYSQFAADPVNGAWYRTAVPGVANNFAKLQNANVYLSDLASQVDYVFPAIYTSSTDIDLWHRYAVNSVYEARRYGKPVIPFLMPTYHHAAAGLNQAVVSPEMWQHQLDLMPQIAEGAIIWTDPYAPTGVDEYWIQMALTKINQTNGQIASLTVPDPGYTPGAGRSFLDDDAESTFSESLIADLL